MKKLNDNQVLTILRLLSEKTDLSKSFALELLKSHRTDAVQKQAAYLLYAYEGERMDSYDPLQALARFDRFESGLEENYSQALNESYKGNLSRNYTVQRGDTLSKIARQHGVALNSLKSVNYLTTDLIKVGDSLVIP